MDGERARMAEAEVSLRLAFWLVANSLADRVDVAIDGAQVKTGATVHFELADFLSRSSWMKKVETTSWQSEYARFDHPAVINVHSRPGEADVVAHLRTGKTLRVECKKGPLGRTDSSPEYRLMREALGQLLTVQTVSDDDILAIAVPDSPKFGELARRWRAAPLVTRYGIRILTVSPSGEVFGLDLLRSE